MDPSEMSMVSDVSVQLRLEAIGGARPDTTSTVLARVLNTGAVVETYHLDLVGAPAAWAVIEPPSVSLLPGDEATATITFMLPQAEFVPSGLIPWGLRG